MSNRFVLRIKVVALALLASVALKVADREPAASLLFFWAVAMGGYSVVDEAG